MILLSVPSREFVRQWESAVQQKFPPRDVVSKETAEKLKEDVDMVLYCCDFCKRQFLCKTWRLKRHKRRYCSRSCVGKDKARDRRKRASRV